MLLLFDFKKIWNGIFFFFFFQFPDVVELNVGGRHFTTHLSTLLKEPHSILNAIFTGKLPISKDTNNRYFIDADGEVFSHILNYLRQEKLPPANMSLEVYEFAVSFKLQSLAGQLTGFYPVQRKLTRNRMLSIYPSYAKIMTKLLKKILDHEVRARHVSIKLPIITVNSNCCSTCKDDAIEDTPEDPRCTTLISQIGEDLRKRGFEVEKSQTACTNPTNILAVFAVGPNCGAQIVTFTVML